MKRLFAFALLFGILYPAQAQQGKSVYDKVCALCHATGIAGAPKLGSVTDWSGRAARGTSVLYASALNGTPRGMPARGGNLELKDAEVKAAVDYMLSRAAPPKPAPAKEVAEKKEAAPEKKEVIAGKKEVAEKTASAPGADVNSFNRLLRPPSRNNPPPSEDGIHDAANDGTHALQPPRSAYATLPRANAGNRVDWVAALAQKRIQPRWDKTDPKAAGFALDLNIVREVKGSMPDVVYPHKQHTEWLDCSNCHPAIFVPQKGANQISMAAILLGEKCGVCHGKVAFPVSECRLCHSRKKDAAGTSSQAAGTPPR